MKRGGDLEGKKRKEKKKDRDTQDRNVNAKNTRQVQLTSLVPLSRCPFTGAALRLQVWTLDARLQPPASAAQHLLVQLPLTTDTAEQTQADGL